MNSYLLKGWLLPVLFVLICLKPVLGQQNLQPGDPVPEIIVASFLEKKQPAINLKRNSKKLIVLDFWSTWCKSCIKALTKLDALQGQFDQDISIIAVTNQDKLTVQNFFIRTGMKLPHLFVKTSDHLLTKYFKFQSLPHTVWISEGKVVYVTYGYNVNELIIKKFLAGERPLLALKDGEKVYDEHAALWDKRNDHFAVKPVCYSYISGWLHDYGGSFAKGITDSVSKTVGVRMINQPLQTLILQAFGQEYKYANRIAKESKLARYVIWGNETEDEEQRSVQNMVCYEINVQQSEEGRIPLFIRDDLERYLPFDLKVAKRMQWCYVIKQCGVAMTSPSCEEGTLTSRQGADEFSYCGGFKSLVAIIQKECSDSKLPIIDMSGYEGKIAVDFKGKLSDIDVVKNILREKGFIVERTLTEIDMLVFSDPIN